MDPDPACVAEDSRSCRHGDVRIQRRHRCRRGFRKSAWLNVVGNQVVAEGTRFSRLRMMRVSYYVVCVTGAGTMGARIERFEFELGQGFFGERVEMGAHTS